MSDDERAPHPPAAGEWVNGAENADPNAIRPDTTGPPTGGRRRRSGRIRQTRLPRGSWPGILMRTFHGYSDDELSDRAAALTYYSVLAIFPGVIALVSFLRIFGAQTSSALIKNIVDLVPGGVGNTINNMINTISHTSADSAVVIAIFSILGSLWSASGYVSAFMRASNDVYDVPEGRPFWKVLPVRLGLTVLSGVLLTASALAVVLTGNLARAVGDAVGVGHTAVNVWNIAKWPVLVVLISLLFAALYWASPNARGRFRPFTVGSLGATAGWLIASGLFAWYVANFGSYNRVYGSLASAIVFLIWLWISNLALLLGAELDAEVRRSRQMAAGHPSDQEPYLELRDTRKLKEPVAEPAVRAYR